MEEGNDKKRARSNSQNEKSAPQDKRRRESNEGDQRRGPPPRRPPPPRTPGSQMKRPYPDDRSNRDTYSTKKPRGDDETKIIERTEVFKIEHSYTIKPDEFEFTHEDLKCVPIVDPDRMATAGFCSEEDIKALWTQKNRMDEVFDNHKQNYYYKSRDHFFPQDRKGSSKFRNRAGDKLDEVDEVVPIFNFKEITFVDICGGPGAFTQLLLDKPCKPVGYGITLEEVVTSDTWYPDLRKAPRFTICKGVDESGNVYNPENLDSVEETIKIDGRLEKVNVCVADGGFEIKKNDAGEHMENYQELFSGQIVLSELLLTVKILQPGGNFVCKLFDAFSYLTQSIIYITTQVFEEVYLVKPIRSRIVNSEKYLVGKSLKRDKNFEFLKQLLAHLHKECVPMESSPKSLVPISILKNDELFMTSAKNVCSVICKKQTAALKIVMDNVDETIKRDESHRQIN